VVLRKREKMQEVWRDVVDFIYSRQAASRDPETQQLSLPVYRSLDNRL
jgi:hypothetical protein